ncbi:heparinase II/III domain-containing protein [Sinomicrobium sp.]
MKTLFGVFNRKYKRILKGVFAVLALAVSVELLAQNATSELSYNYADIAEHPRLLLNKDGSEELKASLKRNPEFKAIDSYIQQVSDDLLTEAPLIFKKRGKRLLAVSRKALTRLYYLSYSYRITGDSRYLNKAEEELNAVCDFESWNPSHFLDVGEMCMAVSIAYDWLYYDLQQNTKEKVRKAIVEKAFKPSYVKKDAWFLDKNSNWNSVCNAGLVFGALAIMEDEKDESIAIIERSLKSNLLPLEAYAPDGNYPEGPGYWNYGTTFQVMMIAALESALGSDNGLSKAPGFLESSYYMLFSGGPSGDYFNYYDCGPRQTARSSMFWFAEKLDDPSLVYQEIDMIRSGVYNQVVSSDIERVLPNALVFGKGLTLSEVKTPTQNMFTGHGITPVTFVRTGWEGPDVKYLGIKGGSASDGHSHMDQGTFVYDTGNLRWAMDFGLQSYITLESKGVDLWNLDQDAQRWDIFRYNNLNHNTLTINNQRHNVEGKAEIVETFEKKAEMGAKVDLTSVLNFDNELKTATRKAVIVDGDYLKIEDVLETNDKAVDLRWNMVTRAAVEIVDKRTIKLSQKGKTMLFKVDTDIPVKLAIRPSENPSQYQCEFGNYKYGDYNQKNKGTIMLGFDAVVPANTEVKFTVTLKEGESDLKLKSNTIILDAPNPSTATEGNKVSSDSSPIGIGPSGDVYPLETPDWNTYGKIDIKGVYNKSFKFRINAKRIDSGGIVNAGIDRSASGLLGVRGGEGNGIEKNEGYMLGLDLSDIDTSVSFQLSKIGFLFLGEGESCTIVNRQLPGKMMVYTGKDHAKVKEVTITSTHKRKMVDVSELGISLKGGTNYEDFLSLFNTSKAGNFRITGFEFKINN